MRLARLALLAALAACASPVAAFSQDRAPPAASPPTERNGLDEQLHRLNVTIDRRLAHGHISRDDADAAHREVYDIQSEVADVRLSNGGRVPSSEHFRLQDRVNKLKEKIDVERAGGASH